LFHPNRDSFQKRSQTAGSASQVRGKKTVALQEWLLVKGDEIELFTARQPSFPKAVIDGLSREPSVVLLSREPFFLRRRNDFASPHNAGSAVMVESGNPEDIHGCGERPSR
jgi:hypothetical protein